MGAFLQMSYHTFGSSKRETLEQTKDRKKERNAPDLKKWFFPLSEISPDWGNRCGWEIKRDRFIKKSISFWYILNTIRAWISTRWADSLLHRCLFSFFLCLFVCIVYVVRSLCYNLRSLCIPTLNFLFMCDDNYGFGE